MHLDGIYVILFSVATAVAVGARRLKIPYTVALVLAGLALGASNALAAPHLTKDLLFQVVLPGLVFEAAFHLELKVFWSQRYAVLALAIPGVVAAVALVGAVLIPAATSFGFGAGFTWVDALTFAALIVATDPIAVVAVFKGLGAPKQLATLVEGESLLNDATGVVMFSLVGAAAFQGRLSLGGAGLDFLRVAGLGAALGAAFGYAISRVIRRIDDPMAELTLTFIAAYGTFALAESLGLSGIMATVVAGLLCGDEAKVGMGPSTRVAVEAAWEYLAFALNSMVFLLIGLSVHLNALLADWLPILVAYVVVTGARAIIVFGVGALLRPTRHRFPWSWAAVLTWAGLRGALSMVLVLSLAYNFPDRELMINMTFGMVLLSILAQGLTVGPLLRWLGIAGTADGRGAA